MIPRQEIDILGVLVTPAVPCVVAALALSYLVRRLLDLSGINRHVWNRALFDVCILVCIASLLILSLRSPGR